AAYFGGGGHDRAAAALIRPTDRPPGLETLAALETELLQILPRYIRPALTVAQIMSAQPRLLHPSTSVQEAARLMQKYGYEGFPVVQEGRVVGLLTRRAVDRALAHKLNLTAASLMEAGEVSVHPEDSIQHLQAVMTDTGWGQVPVVDQDGNVIGIVTRTDLLKTLAPRPSAARPLNLADKLEQALPPERLALLRAVIEAASHQNAALYIVGGFVRDLLLDRPGLDFDLVVEGDAIALAKSLAQRYGGRVIGHSRFGTAKWFLRDGFEAARLGLDQPAALPSFLDFITARTEFYERPTALPTVERSSIKLDLHRRDFTINTLALRLDGRHYGELLDYWGGLADLRAGLVRVLHSLSFVDDPTRMLRAVRFEQRFGFRIEARTLQLMDEARSLLEKLSPERVGHEMDLILDEPAAVSMLARLDELGLLKAIHPALPWDEARRARLDSGLEQTPPSAWGVVLRLRDVPYRRALAYLLWLSDLPPSQIHAISSRLRLAVALRTALLAAHDLLADAPALVTSKPSEVVARLEEVPPLAVFAVWLLVSPEIRPPLEQFLVRWRYVHPRTTGDTLRARGLTPGPQFRKILRRLRDAWLDGEITDEAGEQAFLERLLAEYVC
ncbi:MAG: CBS domain-containing protein, partial [Anaerolineales bacterium]|nr:CBS domain-containing protein [Anaerolineales bacterium]